MTRWLNRSPTMYVPLLVGVLFLPIDTGIDLDDLAVALDRQRLGVVVDARDHFVADGEVRGDVLLTEQPVAEVDAVGVDRYVDRRARLPVSRWAPTHFAIAQPVEGALYAAGWL